MLRPDARPAASPPVTPRPVTSWPVTPRAGLGSDHALERRASAPEPLRSPVALWGCGDVGLWGHRQRLPALEVCMCSPTRRRAKVPLSPRPVSINRQGPRTGLPAAPASWTRRSPGLVGPLRSRAEPWPRGLRSAALEGLSPLPPRRARDATSRGPQAHSDNINCILVCHVGVRTACSKRPASAAPRLSSAPAPAPAQGSSEQLSSLACAAPAHRLGPPPPRRPRTHRLRPSSCA